MNKNPESYKNLINCLNNKLKDRLNDIVFVEFNIDKYLNNGFKISKDILMPIKSEFFISGVKESRYINNIPFQDFIDSMIYVLGCDPEFKYNISYVDILRNIDARIDKYILYKATGFIEKKTYMEALIFFNTLSKISDNHMENKYNIACTLRELALSLDNKKNSEDYNLYYNLSFMEFLELSQDYPDCEYGNYYLGFYYIEDKDYKNALIAWEKALRVILDEDMKNKVQKLIDGIIDNLSFEDCKSEIIQGNIMDGLAKITPLVDKYKNWSEAKYYEALGYRKLGNYKKAKILLDELLKDGEEFSEIYNELGLCHINLGNFEKSVENLNIAVALNPDEPGYLCNLGVAYFKLGDIIKAKHYIDESYKINPKDELTKKCKKMMDDQI